MAWGLAQSVSVLVIEARIPGDNSSKRSLIFSIGTDIMYSLGRRHHEVQLFSLFRTTYHART